MGGTHASIAGRTTDFLRCPGKVVFDKQRVFAKQVPLSVFAEEPYTFSPARFLAVFQAVEGIINMSGYQLLTNDQLALAKTTLRQSLASVPRLDTFIKKLNNSESPNYILKQGLPKFLATANISPAFYEGRTGRHAAI